MSTRLDIPITKPDRLVHALVGAAAALKWLISDPHGPSKRPTAAGRLTGRPSTAPAAPEANMIVLHYRAIPDLRCLGGRAHHTPVCRPSHCRMRPPSRPGPVSR